MNLELPLIESRSEAVIEAIEMLASQSTLEERGAVFTRGTVVDCILDLCGYTTDRPLHRLRLIEPAFGDGDFLLVAIERLLTAWDADPTTSNIDPLFDAIRAVELHTETYDRTRERVIARLTAHGLNLEGANTLADEWLINDDFLLTPLRGRFDIVVGNPPYVRQERIPKSLLAKYRHTFNTLYDRADLYVLFYERGLDLLVDGGSLGFICANRWLKNKYGGPLRSKIAADYHLKFFMDMERADAFHAAVHAYPAITIIERIPAGETLVALNNRDAGGNLRDMTTALRGSTDGVLQSGVTAVQFVANGRDPWLLDAPQVLGVLRALEARYPTLEEAGASVGIGVATGADRVFIDRYDALPVEEQRKLKLAKAADCVNGEVIWGGQGVINPYLESGQLADLQDYPAFANYLKKHSVVLKRRHTARKQPSKWYRTIDRIYPTLTATPKLLIPDIKGEASVAYDPGHFYPHHNLYVVTSKRWDLKALQAILRSSVALMFVAAYCVRMSGGFLRFQAQYIRRIRVPDPAHLAPSTLGALAAVATSQDVAQIDAVVLPLYGLDGNAARQVSEFARSARVSKKRDHANSPA